MNCKGCIYLKEDCVASYFGGAMYWTHHCDYLPHKPKLVDAEAERECENFKEVEACKDIAVPVEA